MDKRCVVRRNHHSGKPPDVVGNAVVRLVIELEHLFDALAHPATDLLRRIVSLKTTTKKHFLLAVGDVEGVVWVEVGLGLAEVKNGVQYIRFPAAVGAKEAVDLVSEGQIQPPMIAELKQMKMLQAHDANFLIFAPT